MAHVADRAATAAAGKSLLLTVMRPTEATVKADHRLARQAVVNFAKARTARSFVATLKELTTLTWADAGVDAEHVKNIASVHRFHMPEQWDVVVRDHFDAFLRAADSRAAAAAAKPTASAVFAPVTPGASRPHTSDLFTDSGSDGDSGSGSDGDGGAAAGAGGGPRHHYRPRRGSRFYTHAVLTAKTELDEDTATGMVSTAESAEELATAMSTLVSLADSGALDNASFALYLARLKFNAKPELWSDESRLLLKDLEAFVEGGE